MKQSRKIAFCGIFAALTTVIMLAAYFPYITYSVPAIAGLLSIVLVIEMNPKWALIGYIVSSVLVFVFAENEAKLLFICFFGYYPIIKYKLESINNRVLEYILKFLVFNVAVIVAYIVLIYILGFTFENMNGVMMYTQYILLFFANVVFLIYDFLVTKVIFTYYDKFHKSVSRMLK